jgi:hypothetical protein
VQVSVTATLSFFSGNFSVTASTMRYATLVLSTPAPANGLTVNLHSDNTGIATVRASVTFAPGANTVPVLVTGVAAGSTLIHASAPNISDGTINVTVQ